MMAFDGNNQTILNAFRSFTFSNSSPESIPPSPHSTTMENTNATSMSDASLYASTPSLSSSSSSSSIIVADDDPDRDLCYHVGYAGSGSLRCFCVASFCGESFLEGEIRVGFSRSLKRDDYQWKHLECLNSDDIVSLFIACPSYNRVEGWSMLSPNDAKTALQIAQTLLKSAKKKERELKKQQKEQEKGKQLQGEEQEQHTMMVDASSNSSSSSMQTNDQSSASINWSHPAPSSISFAPLPSFPSSTTSNSSFFVPSSSSSSTLSSSFLWPSSSFSTNTSMKDQSFFDHHPPAFNDLSSISSHSRRRLKRRLNTPSSPFPRPLSDHSMNISMIDHQRQILRPHFRSWQSPQKNQNFNNNTINNAYHNNYNNNYSADISSCSDSPLFGYSDCGSSVSNVSDDEQENEAPMAMDGEYLLSKKQINILPSATFRRSHLHRSSPSRSHQSLHGDDDAQRIKRPKTDPLSLFFPSSSSYPFAM